jgi:hypothetical protein
MLKVTASDDGDVSKVLEDIGAPLAVNPEGRDDPQDTSDLPSMLADQSADLHG